MNQVRLTRLARNDIKSILRRSEIKFGEAVRIRYKRLLDQAIRDVADDPRRVGVSQIEEVRLGYCSYPIKWSKPRVVGPPIGNPRHILIFSIGSNNSITIAAVVHEREMLDRHLKA